MWWERSVCLNLSHFLKVHCEIHAPDFAFVEAWNKAWAICLHETSHLSACHRFGTAKVRFFSIRCSAKQLKHSTCIGRSLEHEATVNQKWICSLGTDYIIIAACPTPLISAAVNLRAVDVSYSTKISTNVTMWNRIQVEKLLVPCSVWIRKVWELDALAWTIVCKIDCVMRKICVLESKPFSQSPLRNPCPRLCFCRSLENKRSSCKERLVGWAAQPTCAKVRFFSIRCSAKQLKHSTCIGRSLEHEAKSKVNLFTRNWLIIAACPTPLISAAVNLRAVDVYTPQKSQQMSPARGNFKTSQKSCHWDTLGIYTRRLTKLLHCRRPPSASKHRSRLTQSLALRPLVWSVCNTKAVLSAAHELRHKVTLKQLAPPNQLGSVCVLDRCCERNWRKTSAWCTYSRDSLALRIANVFDLHVTRLQKAPCA